MSITIQKSNVCQLSTPWGGVTFKQNLFLLGTEWDVSRSTQKYFCKFLHLMECPWAWGVNLKQKCLLQIEWNVQICTENPCLPTILMDVEWESVYKIFFSSYKLYEMSSAHLTHVWQHYPMQQGGGVVGSILKKYSWWKFSGISRPTKIIFYSPNSTGDLGLIPQIPLQKIALNAQKSTEI